MMTRYALSKCAAAKCILAAIAVWAAFATIGESVWASRWAALQQALKTSAGPADGAMVQAADGTLMAQINADRRLIPASILKLLTALVAIETLGGDYRFQTAFFQNERDDLIIKGYGDPMLVSERLATIAQRLAAKRVRVNDIVLDDSYFHQPVIIPGRMISNQPYDAPNGALCVNFNTVAFRREGNRWVSGEPQTPLLPFVIPIIEASGQTNGRVTLAATSDEALQYTGQMFRYFLHQAGIATSGIIRRGKASPDKHSVLWRYRSEDTLSEVIQALLEYSNNFIANQLLLVIGAHGHPGPARIKNGVAALTGYLEARLGISAATIAEGSGISRRNRITPRTMMAILDRFAPYRRLLRKSGRQYYKTGHLKGIRTRAGYLVNARGGFIRFVVMVNTPGKTTTGMMRAIEKHVK